MVARSTTIGEDRTNSGSHNDRSWPPTIDRMINSVGRRMWSDLNPRNISTLYSVSEQPIGGTTGRMVARPVARLIVRPLTIWISRFQVLNMTIDLVATDLPPCDHPRPLPPVVRALPTSRTIVLRLAHHYNIFRSQVGRNLVVSRCDRVTTYLRSKKCCNDGPIVERSYDWWQSSYDRSTIGPSLQHFSIAGRS